MAVFKYTAMGNDGKTITGTFSAPDRAQIVHMIRAKGQYPVDIKEVIEKKDVKDLGIMNKVKVKDIAVFCRQFYSMLNAGVTIVKALDILHQQTTHKRLKTVIKEIYEAVQKGQSLSESMRSFGDVFPELLINMIASGEVSGSLDKSIERMAIHFEKETRLKNKIRAAMVYPIILSVVAVLVVIFLLTFIMPTFVGMFVDSGVELPGPTRVLMGISGVFQNYWFVLIGGFFLAFYILRAYRKSEKGKLKLDTLMLKIPVIKNTVTIMSAARFTRTMSTLLYSGIPILQAMEVVARVVSNGVIKRAILIAGDEMRKGADLATPIKRSGVFPPMVDSMIRIGEESGTLDQILGKTAEFYEDELETALQKMASLIEPVIIVVMGGLIGFIVVSMIMPMFAMMQTIE